jgi:hypothetical protein
MKYCFDETAEDFISLKEVPLYLPKRHGKKVHYSTIYRWATKGVRGQVLASILIGGLRYTTVEALHAFRLTTAKQQEQSNVVDAIERVLSNT